MLRNLNLGWALTLAACAASTEGRMERLNDSFVDWGAETPTAVDPLEGVEKLHRAAFVKMVLDRHPTQRAAKEAVKAAIARVSQRASWPTPMLVLGLAPLSIGSDTVSFGGSAELRQKLPNPIQLDLMEEQAGILAEIERDRAESARRALAARAASSFDDYTLVQAAILVNQSHADLLEAMRLSTASNYAVGRASGDASTEVEMESIRILREGIALRSEAQNLAAQLNLLLGRPADLPLPPLVSSATSTSDPTPRDVAALEETAVAARPEVRGAARREVAGGLAQSLADWAAWPDLEFMTSYNSMWHDPEHRWMIGLGLSLPLNLSALRGQREEAEAEARAARFELEATALEVRAEVIEAHRNMEEIDAALSLYRDRMRSLAQERRDLVRANVDAGVESYRSLIEAERSVRQVDLEILAMEREASRRRVALELALGRTPGLESKEVAP